MQRIIKACDMFTVSQFTNYRNKGEYSTLTGGITSIVIFAVLIAIFIDKAI